MKRVQEDLLSRSSVRCIDHLFRSLRDQVAHRYRFSDTHALVLSAPASAAVCSSAAAAAAAPEVHGDSSLVRNVRFAEALLSGSTEEDCPVLILVPPERLSAVLDELRRHFPSKMVGEADWADTALDYIVASPDHVTDFHHGTYISAFIVDGGSADFPGAIKAISRIECFSNFSAWQNPEKPFEPATRNCPALVAYTGPRPTAPSFVSVSHRLLRHLPEASDCPGLGDCSFRDLVHVFSRSKSEAAVSVYHIKHDSSVSIADWSGILALLPGLVRMSRYQGRSCLIAAPSSRVSPVVELIKVFAKHHLGLSDTSFVITPSDLNHGQQPQLLVCSLEDLDTETSRKIDPLLVYCNKVVFLELDSLLESGRKTEIEWILSGASNATFVFHYTSQSGRERWSRSIVQPAGGVKLFWSAEASLSNIRLFTCKVNTEAKVEKLRELIQNLKLYPNDLVLVLCNSEEKAIEVAEELSFLGVNAAVRGQERAEVSSSSRAGAKVRVDTAAGCLEASRVSGGVVLVSDVEDRESMKVAELVVLFEMPEDDRRYAARCGGFRSARRFVVNLVSSRKDMEFLRGLGRELTPLPEGTRLKKIHLLYPLV